jgi:hypothetical protein
VKRPKSGTHIPICLLLLLTCLIAFGVWSAHKINSEAQSLLVLTDHIRQSLDVRDYPEAQRHCGLLLDQWNGYHRYWTLLISHQEMDHIFESMSKLNQFLRFGDEVDSWAELDTLVHFIKHIPEKESLNIQNLV